MPERSRTVVPEWSLQVSLRTVHTERPSATAREGAKSVGQAALLGRISFLGLSRLWNRADLSHQAKLVLDVP